jgi:nudix-type nucleoside diphosphatase (YffH/AdpP family)
VSPPIRIRSDELLSKNWGRLSRVTFDFTRRDGTVETQVREIYDRGNGAAILPVDAARGTVLLVRQFRMPAYVNGHDGYLIEACAGLLDDLDPKTAIRKEAEEELGYRLGPVTHIFDAYMSPGSVTERLALFTAPYTPADRISAGGGALHEGEDIEVIEMPLERAFRMIADGGIVDGKTILLLQHAMLARFGARGDGA